MDEPFFSVSVGHITEYRAADFAAGIAGLPGLVSTRDDQHERTWRWENGPRWVEITVDSDNVDDAGVWLGSITRADCTFADLVAVWQGLRRTFPAVYLHDRACRMFTPVSFLEEVAARALAPALASPDSATAERAAAEYRRYRELAGPPRRWAGHWAERVPHAAASLFDFAPPVGRLLCDDRWTGKEWVYRAAEFDRAAAARGLRYFAHPTDWTDGGKYRSGFAVWCRLPDLAAARRLAADLGVLSARDG
jgi:hypothetical protein